MNKRVLFRCPIDGYTGYGRLACQLVECFLDLGCEVSVIPTHVRNDFGAGVKDKVVQCLTTDCGQRDELVLGLPSIASKIAHPAVLLTMWETDGLHPDWVPGLNRMKAIIVPSQWQANAFRSSGVTAAIHVIPLGIRLSDFPFREMFPQTMCFFGAAGRLEAGGARKGIEEIIQLFQTAFPNETDVALRLKLFPDCVVPAIKDWRISVAQCFFSESELVDWYAGLSCFVSTSRGEGWGLMIQEAMAVGRPAIATQFGGQSEFFDETVGYVVDYTFSEAQGIYSQTGHWGIPNPDGMVRAMRQVYRDPSDARGRGIRASKRARNFPVERTALRILDVLRAGDSNGIEVVQHSPRGSLRSFKHSGDAGDIIYSLPVMRCVGGGTLYLAKSDFTRVPISPQSFANIAPLLMTQPYVHEVKMWHGEAVAFDMDHFRNSWNVGNNIAAQHLKAFGLPVSELESAWLEVKSYPHVVVINRTARYQNPHFPWRTVMAKYRDCAVFVGTAAEHTEFVNEFGWVPFVPTKTLLELAQIIAGCTLFIGNQSTPYAIAEAMKKPVIQEVCLYSPNCLFPRPKAQFVAGERIELPDV